MLLTAVSLMYQYQGVLLGVIRSTSIPSFGAVHVLLHQYTLVTEPNMLFLIASSSLVSNFLTSNIIPPPYTITSLCQPNAVMALYRSWSTPLDAVVSSEK